MSELRVMRGLKIRVFLQDGNALFTSVPLMMARPGTNLRDICSDPCAMFVIRTDPSKLLATSSKV